MNNIDQKPNGDFYIEENQFLKEENIRLANVVRERDDEITRLNVYIYEHKKLRIVIRDLASAIDKSISVRLAERAKRRKHYPLVKVGKVKSMKAPELYKVINSADKEAYLSDPSLIQQLSTNFFTITLKIYKLTKKSLRRVLRFTKRGVMKVARGNAHE